MTGKLLTRLFALFGMTLTCVACYGVGYTEFNPSFSATGRVVDKSGAPIEGIEARCGENRITTDENGRFHISGTKPWLSLKDIDGEANGGEFEDMTFTLGESGSQIELGDIEMQQK